MTYSAPSRSTPSTRNLEREDLGGAEYVMRALPLRHVVLQLQSTGSPLYAESGVWREVPQLWHTRRRRGTDR